MFSNYLSARVTRRASGVSSPRTQKPAMIEAVYAWIALAVLSSASAFAASYVVPPDDVFVNKAERIVVARAVGSYVRETLESGIETVTEFTVEEPIKADVVRGGALRVVIPGGVIDGRVKVIPGSPRFADGEEYLLFLSKRPNGEFAATDFALGVFAFAYDDLGRRVAVRNDGEIVGWDVDGMPHREARRDAGRFLDYVRQVAGGGHPAGDYRIDPRPLVGSVRAQSKSQHRAAPSTVYTATSYTIPIQGGSSGPGTRWNSFPGAVNWNQGSSQISAGTTAINTAFSSWNGGGGNVNYVLASHTPNSNGILDPADGVNNIVFEKDLTSIGAPPFSCSSGGVLGVGGISSATSSLNTQNGESFWTTGEGDVSMNQGLGACVGTTFSVGDFNSAVTHEVGHTLGWRHADQTRADTPGIACSTDQTLECSGFAIMTAFVTSNLNGSLQTWDQHAVQAVYGSGPVCTPPSISIQPAGSTINAGQQANLSVTAGGSTPLSYQWYVGTPPSTASPVPGGNTSSINVSPTSTTSYWVQVTNSCPGTANSNAATVTVSACSPPQISGQPSGSVITSGQLANLSVSATGSAPLSYQWYIGNPPSTASPVPGGSSSSINVSPTSTTTYWVQVANTCAPGSPANSVAATVTVSAVSCPTVSIGAPTATPVSGGYQLSINASTGSGGGTLSYAWFSNGSLVGSGNPFTVNPVIQTSYSAVVSNGCGNSAVSSLVTITPSQTCTAPAITTATATPASITSGGSSSLSVSATGTSLNYQWYTGQPGDLSHKVTGGSSATITVSPTQTTTYWVQVSSGCGAQPANSGAIVVTVASACPAPTVTQPADQTIGLGQVAFITVSATGTVPLHYAWFQGAAGDTSKAVGTDAATLATASLRTNTTFWVRVTNGCGSSANSGTITITVKSSRNRASTRR